MTYKYYFLSITFKQVFPIFPLIIFGLLIFFIQPFLLPFFSLYFPFSYWIDFVIASYYLFLSLVVRFSYSHTYGFRTLSSQIRQCAHLFFGFSPLILVLSYHFRCIVYGLVQQ